MIMVNKILNGYAPPIMENLFVFRGDVNNIRYFQVIHPQKIKITRYGLEKNCHRTCFLWVNLSIDIKLATSLSDFKTNIKSWKCNSSVCRLLPDFPARLKIFIIVS